MITKDQALNPANREFWHVSMKNADGTPVRCRRNGATKVWKTKPELFELPVKSGLYQYGKIATLNARDWCLPSLWEAEAELWRDAT